MSLTLSTLPPIYPVYTDNLVLNIYDTSATSLYFYQCKIYVDDVLVDTLNYPANPTTYDADINLSTILSTKFDSYFAITNSSTMFDYVNGSVVKYRVDVFSYNGSVYTSVSGTTGDRWTFNGCCNDRYNTVFRTIYPLTDWENERELPLNTFTSTNMVTDVLHNQGYVTMISGDYTPVGDTSGHYKSSLSGITITAKDYDGTARMDSIPNLLQDDNNKCLVHIRIDYAMINLILGYELITKNTEYYTIGFQTYWDVPKITIYLPVQAKINDDSGYNFVYLNNMGGRDFFTALGVDNIQYGVKKQTLDQYVIQKPYGTDVDREVTVQTQFLTPYQANRIKDLFSSPCVKLNHYKVRKNGGVTEYYDNVYGQDVQITNKEITIRSKYPKTDFITYTITFKYLNKNYIQKY